MGIFSNDLINQLHFFSSAAGIQPIEWFSLSLSLSQLSLSLSLSRDVTRAISGKRETSAKVSRSGADQSSESPFSVANPGGFREELQLWDLYVYRGSLGGIRLPAGNALLNERPLAACRRQPPFCAETILFALV